jgi:sigma-E factor negative regulatory protein RseB
MRRLARWSAWVLWCVAPLAWAQDMGVQQWLERLHNASSNRAFIGTYVLSAGSEMAASKIWHICDGQQQMERIESLTGAPRTTLRRNDEVMTFAADTRTVLKEKRESLRLFPDLNSAPGQQIAAFYGVKVLGQERVAGHDADVLVFQPKDKLRFAYKVWAERKTGLVVKLQTLATEGQVLEQVAFTELQLDAPVKMENLSRLMANTKGYQVLEPDVKPTTAEAQGWRLKTPVAGFAPVGCHVRVDTSAGRAGVMQWVFSDGMAAVSLFVETLDPVRHSKEKSAAAGATHTLAGRVGDHWVTAMGEVPVETLRLFVSSLERKR